MFGCHCCGLKFDFCKCSGEECPRCHQCKAHCECEEELAEAKRQEDMQQRRLGRAMSLETQQQNLKKGLMRSGMAPKEAIFRARNWWDKIGRKIVRIQFNQEYQGGSFKPSSGKAPGVKVSPTLAHVVPSGILKGLPWAQLTKPEKFRVAKEWHDTEYMMNFPLLEQKLIFKHYQKKEKKNGDIL